MHGVLKCLGGEEWDFKLQGFCSKKISQVLTFIVTSTYKKSLTSFTVNVRGKWEQRSNNSTFISEHYVLRTASPQEKLFYQMWN